jgi:hypothetical protein
MKKRMTPNAGKHSIGVRSCIKSINIKTAGCASKQASKQAITYHVSIDERTDALHSIQFAQHELPSISVLAADLEESYNMKQKQYIQLVEALLDHLECSFDTTIAVCANNKESHCHELQS